MRRAVDLALLLCLAAADAAIAQTPIACPSTYPEGTACYVGADANDANYFIAVPARWNGVLVMHAHGGPSRTKLSVKRALARARRWAVWPQEGYAYAASEYRRGGYGARMAADDTEALRQLFVARFGTPRRTVLHGQSWGALVAAKAVERYADEPGLKPYDGALLTSGMLAGAPRGYDFRLDLRVVYQYYCRNHPRPDEVQYPLWQGLAAGSDMSPRELRARIAECTGFAHEPAKRTAEQRARLAHILAVIRIAERSLDDHLAWATFMFADLVQRRLGGRNPFSNDRVRYTGSDDDDALNRGVARYAADPAAVADLAADSQPTGRVTIPTLTMHAIDDPIAFVEVESAYRALRQRAGSDDLLVQTYTRERRHGYLASAGYAASMRALLEWTDDGLKPTPQAIAADCEQHPARQDGACAFDAAYAPPPYDERVPARGLPAAGQ